MATFTNAELVAQVYVGFYDRAPDPTGLQYWVGRLEAGVSIQDIGDSFAASPEASDTYPFFKYPDLLLQKDFLAQVYQNVFGRAIDADGLKYYSDRMEAGESAGSVVASILGNASTNDGSPDQAFLQNKVDAGLHWALEAAATNAAIYQDNGRLTDAASASAQGILDGVTADPKTVDAANAASDTFFENGSTDGKIFTLTDAGNVITGGVDIINGTDGADTIRAILGASLDSTDIIDGGAGNDTLDIKAGGIDNGGLTVAAPVIKNVETINNAGGSLDLSAVTGVNVINTTSNGHYSNASLATIFGAAGAVTAVEIGLAAGVAGTNDTLHLAVDDNANPVVFTTWDSAAVPANNSVGIEHITLAANGDTGATNVTDVVDLSAFTAIKSLTVTGGGDVDILNASVELVKLDASAAIGDVIYASGALTHDATATGGSGADTLDFSLATHDVTVNGGAGNDIITGGAGDSVLNGGAGNDIITAGTGDSVITGGAGADTINVGGGDVNIVYTAQTDSTYVNFDTINGFAAGDTIDLSAFHLTGDAGVVVGDTTQDAIGGLSNVVTGFFGDAAVATFTDVNTGLNYVLADLNNDGNFDQAHDLVILTGGVLIGDADLVL